MTNTVRRTSAVGLLALVLLVPAVTGAQAGTRRLGPDDPQSTQAGGPAVAWQAENITVMGQIGGRGTAIAVSGTRALVGVGQRIEAVDLTDPAQLRARGSVLIGGSPWAIVLIGSTAYVAADVAGLIVLDVSDLADPHVIGQYDTTGETRALVVVGSLAYLADGSTGLVIVDVGDPRSPTMVGHFDSAGEAIGVAVRAGHAYVADGQSGLRVLDVRDPGRPIPVDWIEGWVAGITAGDRVALAPVSGRGVAVLDLADPAHPREVSRIPISGCCSGLVLIADTAYLLRGGNLDIVDLADPANPRTTTATDLSVFYDHDLREGSAGVGLVVVGTRLYTASNSGGLNLIDVSKVKSPKQLGTLSLAGGAREVALFGTAAFVPGDSGTTVVDVADARHPRAIEPRLPSMSSVDADGGRLYGIEAGVLTIYDLTTPLAPRAVGSIAGIQPLRYDVAGGRAYLLNQDGLTIFDVVDPSRPRLLGRLTDLGTPFDVFAAGDRAVVAADGKVHLVNVTDPGSPRIVATVSDPRGYALSAVFTSSWLWILAGTPRTGGFDCYLRLIDIHAPDQPREVAWYEGPGDGHRLRLADGRVFVRDAGSAAIFQVGAAPALRPVGFAPGGEDLDVSGDTLFGAGSPGLVTYDIRDLSLPRHISAIGSRLTGSIVAVSLADPLAIGLDPFDGFMVADISAPRRPVRLTDVLPAGRMHGPMAAAGRRVYLVNRWLDQRPDFIETFDLTDPRSPRSLGAFPVSAPVQDLAVVESTLFVVSQYGTLTLFRVDGASSPRKLSDITVPGARAVAVAWPYAYLATGDYGLAVVDVSNPAEPRQLAALPLPGYALRVVLAGPYAYVAAGEAGLHIVDIADPVLPVALGTLRAGPGIELLAATSDRLFVNTDVGVQVFDLGEPSSPRVVARFAAPVWVTGIAAARDTAAVVDGNGALWLLQVGDGQPEPTVTVTPTPRPSRTPTQGAGTTPATPGPQRGRVYLPHLVAGRPTPPAAPQLIEVGRLGGAWQAVAAGGRWAYVGIGPRVATVDLADPTSPTLRALSDPLPGDVLALAVGSGMLYVACGRSGFAVLDLATVDRPRLTRMVGTPGMALDIVVTGSRAFVADWDSGLRIYDLADPGNPTEQAGLDTGGLVASLAVLGSYVYLADSQEGVVAFDVSQPSAPRRVGTHAVPSGALAVAAAGDRLVAMTMQRQLVVLAHAAGDRLTELGLFPPTPGASGLAMDGDTVYVLFVGGGSVAAYDVSNPAEPRQTGQITVAGEPQAAVVVAGLLAVVVDSTGLWLLSFAAAGEPTTAGHLPSYYSTHAVAVAGTLAFLAAGPAGLRIVDVSDPVHPVDIGGMETLGSADAIALQGHLAYLGEGWTNAGGMDALGLRIVDVSDPVHPRAIGFFRTFDEVRNVTLDGDRAFVAEDGQFWVLDLADPENPREITLYSPPDGIVAVAFAGPLAYVVTDSDELQVLDFSVAASPVLVGRLARPNWSPSLIRLAASRACIAQGGVRAWASRVSTSIRATAEPGIIPPHARDTSMSIRAYGGYSSPDRGAGLSNWHTGRQGEASG